MNTVGKVVSWVGNFGIRILCLHFRWSGWPHLQLEKTSPWQLEGPISAKPAKLDLWRNSLRIYNHGYNWTWHVAMYFGACGAACDSCRYGNVIRKHTMWYEHARFVEHEKYLAEANVTKELWNWTKWKKMSISTHLWGNANLLSVIPMLWCHHLPRCLDLLSTSSVQADTLGQWFYCVGSAFVCTRYYYIIIFQRYVLPTGIQWEKERRREHVTQ